MNTTSLYTYCVVASVAIVTPGPAILLAIRNSISYGIRSVAWSSLGNITGLLLLSTAAMFGLAILLKSSPLLFTAVKIAGGVYMLYIGFRYLFGRAALFVQVDTPSNTKGAPSPVTLFRQAFILAISNPKPILFFSALFPQFIEPDGSLTLQFLLLTGIFMGLSYFTLMIYGFLAARAILLFQGTSFGILAGQGIGLLFLFFGGGMLFLGQPVV